LALNFSHQINLVQVTSDLSDFVLSFLSLMVSISFSLSLFQEGGSYQQRVLTEYLKGIQSRAEDIVQLLQGKP
jgi:hypothetical protein